MKHCECKERREQRRVVLTGGPGAGKTAVLELIRQSESPIEAQAVDDRILHAWSGHPRRHLVDAKPGFLAKAASALEVLREELPVCCRTHVIPALHGHG